MHRWTAAQCLHMWGQFWPHFQQRWVEFWWWCNMDVVVPSISELTRDSTELIQRRQIYSGSMWSAPHLDCARENPIPKIIGCSEEISQICLLISNAWTGSMRYFWLVSSASPGIEQTFWALGRMRMNDTSELISITSMSYSRWINKSSSPISKQIFH